MQALLDVILPVFLVIGFGYLAVWKGWFSQSGVDGLMKFTQNFAIPCLLFSAIARLDLSASFQPALLFSFYVGAVSGFVLGTLGARVFFKRRWSDSIAIGFCALFSNSVLLGLPITERAYGSGALEANFAIIAIHSPFCYAIGITAMEFVRAKGQGALAILRSTLNAMFHNALIIGITAGFVVNLSGIALPTVLMDALEMMVRAALPAALFGLGGVLTQYRPEGDLKTIFYVIFLSLVLHPTLTYLSSAALGLSQTAQRSAVLTAAMAPGINTYIFANMYGVAKRVAASSVLIATALSVVTVWLWLMILGT